MNIELSVTVESTWRGPILDTVFPVLKATLEPDSDRPGSLSLEQEIKLADSSVVKVWCIYRGGEEFILHVYDSEFRTLFKVESPSKFYTEAVLPDGKQYQFKLGDAQP
ncbi:hypothetical protein SAMN05660691_04127 [Rheinheimera pacifica]|uniref:Uncharacterized protein n=1 Tax=Rheinheimera pacifica TaxID=173990 RepID=A0A1H6NKW0_9GAMM|nr:hypothetical protein [Rheinheimera pacifica]SEI13802.1 hypothetical protein SAMN05660691_04127 [Rheinheimera pacifica]